MKVLKITIIMTIIMKATMMKVAMLVVSSRLHQLLVEIKWGRRRRVEEEPVAKNGVNRVRKGVRRKQKRGVKRGAEKEERVKKNNKIMEHLTNDIYINDDNILGKLRMLDNLKGEQYDKLYDEIIQVGEFENN